MENIKALRYVVLIYLILSTSGAGADPTTGHGPDIPHFIQPPTTLGSIFFLGLA